MKCDPAAYAWRLFAAKLHRDVGAERAVQDEIGGDVFVWTLVADDLATICATEALAQIRSGRLLAHGITADDFYAHVAHQIDVALNPDIDGAV